MLRLLLPERPTLPRYYPLLQELTFIRPLRMLSPNAFANGITTSPVTHNSCPASWGEAIGSTVNATCAGIRYPSGTGPFRFVSRSGSWDPTSSSGADDRVTFAANANYWDGAPDMDFLHIVRYDTAADVKAALLADELDAVVGAGVLAPEAVAGFK